jgi:hypothetical protein
MKRFIGLLMTAAGVTATLWGGYRVLTGQSSAQIVIAEGFAITALIAGLAGVALVSIGFVWMRD